LRGGVFFFQNSDVEHSKRDLKLNDDRFVKLVQMNPKKKKKTVNKNAPL
jgi:hypothetical protein